MKKITILFILGLIFMTGFSMAEATNDNSGTPAAGAIKEQKQIMKDNFLQNRQENKEQKQNFKQSMEEIRADFHQAIQERNENIPQLFQEKREIAIQVMREKREQFKLEVEAAQEAMRQKIQQNREELKEKLGQLRDNRKKQIVERIDVRFEELNKNRVKHFTNVLDRLEQILGNVESRVDKAEANGKNVADARNAVSAAEEAISQAREAVLAQAGKTYEITVTTEESLGQDIVVVRKQLFEDLSFVREKVKDARDAVHNSATTLAKIPGVNSYEISNNSTSTVGNSTSTD